MAKIGCGASQQLESRGLTVYEAPFPIEPLIEKIIADRLWAVYVSAASSATAVTLTVSVSLYLHLQRSFALSLYILSPEIMKYSVQRYTKRL